MKGISFILLCLLLVACGNNKTDKKEEDAAPDFESFSAQFKNAGAGYSLADSDLIKSKDTATLQHASFITNIPDSVKLKLTGKITAVKYTPLAKIKSKDGEHYFILKASGNSRKAALAVAFNKDESYGAAFPFLIPDADPATTQVSTIDKSYSVSRSVIRKTKEEVVTEGKDVYAYNTAAKSFTLIMTDLLDDTRAELINPIDTFSKKHPLAGDYGTGKKNIVSVRDGRNEKEINFYIHFEKEEGCIGELTGTAFFTSTKVAVYRQGGDACVLQLQFTPTTVTLKEEEGCGLHRGVKCVFDGSYQKIKAVKKKPTAKKTTTT